MPLIISLATGRIYMNWFLGMHPNRTVYAFAHLAEALNVIKPDVVLESLVRVPGTNKCSDGGHGSWMKGKLSGKKMQPGVCMSNLSRERASLHQSPNNIINDKHRGMSESNVTCMDAEDVNGIVIHDLCCKKAINGQFDVHSPPQTMEQAAPLTAQDGLQGKFVSLHHRALPTSCNIRKDHATSSYELLGNAWECNFPVYTQPSMVPSSHLARCRCSKYSFRSKGATQSSTACKLTLKQLPLRGFQVQVNITRTDVSNDEEDLPQKREKKKRIMIDRGVQNAQVLKQLFCGGVAGVISRTVVAPLDLIKTYLVTSRGVRGSQKSAFVIGKEIIESSGWQGLFRGNLVNCIRVAPNKAIELCVFETVRKELNKEGHPLKNVAATLAGGAAGMAATVATYPLELIRTRLSVQPGLYTGVLQTSAKIFREEGFMAFYSGLIPSLVGIFPYAATNYFIYDGLRTMYRSSTGCQHVPLVPTLAFGALAAAASSTVTYPLEVARSQLQLSLQNAMNKSSVSIMLDICKHEGFLALYRGLGTTWLKLIPAAGISFMCYEAARLALSIDDASILVKAKMVSTATKENVVE